METGRPLDGSPQFVPPGKVPIAERSDGPILVGVVLAPMVVAIVRLFWTGLDDPPLESLAWLVEIIAVVATAVVAMELARLRGVSTPLAIVIGIVATPFLVFTATFVTIAAAFSLGSIF